MTSGIYRKDERVRVDGATIVAAARRYVGIPFRHQGRDPRIGIDCVGLCALVARDVGVPPHDETTYARTPNPRHFLRVLSQTCERVSRFDVPDALEPDEIVSMLPGDLVVTAPSRLRFPRHAGIVTDVGILHAVSTAGIARVVEQRWTPQLLAHRHSLWRLR
jgi:cell wall-associated NlpC family hydrolase